MVFYIDTNIFVYAIENHPKNGKSCARILSKIQEKKMEAASSILILVELISARASFANTGKVQFLISESINCSNFSFCGGPTYIQTLGATVYADHTFTAASTATQYNVKGHVAYSATEVLVGTWKVVSGYFVVMGRNTTTVVVAHHATTTTKHFSNYNTTTPATPTTLDCAQIVGVHCPAGVTASETIVRVS